MNCRWAALSPLLYALALTACAPELRPQPPAKKVIPQSPQVTAPRRITAAPISAPPPELQKPAGKLTRIALGDYFAKQQAATTLTFDVRPAFFYQLSHIPGALSWPKNQYEAQLARHESEISSATAAGKTIVLYCTDLACPDARTVGTRLAARGHSVTLLEGGWEAWKAGELPTE